MGGHSANLYDALAARGMVAQATDEVPRARFAEPLTAYIGFDPTADSLHVGSLVPVMALRWLQRCGHRPLALVGGATGLVGDPSGKTAMRRMLTADDVRANVAALGAQIGRIVRFGDGPSDARLVDNAEWLCSLAWIDLLREVGPLVSVNRMLSMDSVRSRLEAGDGLSFLEFNYMVMQAYDFLYLHRSTGCTVQMGGQDQWGNIVMGIELGRRLAGVSLAGLTLPLVTKADGSKFGKSEAGNIWLAAERTPPWQFWQFWRNVADADVGRFLAFFTDLDMETVAGLAARSGAARNEAKEVLAHEVTCLVHGEAAALAAATDARRAFAGGDASGDSVPHARLAAAELETGLGLLTALVRAGLASSNGEARRLIQGGGLRVNERQIDDPTAHLDGAAVQDGCIVMRVGKKRLFRFDVV